MADSLLAKLEPEAMMADDAGPGRARVALQVLERRSADAAAELGLEIVASGGARILIITSVMHPEADMRRAAWAVIAACVRADRDGKFRSAAVDARLTDACARVCREGDEKAAAAAEQGSAVDLNADPNLPVWLASVGAVEALLLGPTEEAAELREALLPSVAMLVGSKCAALQRRALELLRTMCKEDPTAPPAISAALGGPQPLIDVAADDDGDVHEAAIRLIHSLRWVPGWREKLAEGVQADEALLAEAEAPMRC